MRRLILLLLAVAILPTDAAFGVGETDNEVLPSAEAADGELTAYVLLSTTGETVASVSLAARPGQGGVTMSCSYYASAPVGFEPAPDLNGGPVWPPEPDTAYFIHCVDPDGDLVHAELLIYDPADPFGALDDSEEALELALAQLRLPEPAIGLAPPAGDHLVGLPSWFWTDTPWVPLDVSAQLGTVTSTVTATPVRMSVDPGDGGPVVTCDGPGTPWAPGREGPPPCGHTFQQGGVYTITVTITWQVRWTSTTGQGGPLPDQTTVAAVTAIADEAQAVLGNP
jgi:hypothetical protein